MDEERSTRSRSYREIRSRRCTSVRSSREIYRTLNASQRKRDTATLLLPSLSLLRHAASMTIFTINAVESRAKARKKCCAHTSVTSDALESDCISSVSQARHIYRDERGESLANHPAKSEIDPAGRSPRSYASNANATRATDDQRKNYTRR